MQQAIQVVVNIVFLTIAALQLLIIVRAISSWFPFSDDNPIINFLYLLTEPILAPVRALTDRISFLRDLPIDIAPLLTVCILMLVEGLLPPIHF